MKPSKKIIELIKEFEGFSAIAYQCPAGIWTLGYGSTHVGGKPVVKGMTCTRDEAEQWIFDELDPVSDRITAMLKVEVTQEQFDVLCDFAYNLGTGNLSGSTFLKKINLKDFVGAGPEILKWDKAGGKVLGGLTRRRKKEYDIWCNGYTLP